MIPREDFLEATRRYKERKTHLRERTRYHALTLHNQVQVNHLPYMPFPPGVPKFVPKDKLVVLGLVTTKRPELESKDLLKRRIEEATKYIGIEQLCLSGQCGFSSTVEGNALTRDEQIAKLNLTVETAAEVWG